jgi:LPS-assembly lipoprotein
MNVWRLLVNSLVGLALAATLAGCGFQLRGQSQLPFESAYVESHGKSQENSDRNERRPALSASLAASLRQSLSTQNKLAANAKDAPVRIVLNNESLTKTILALSGGGKVREYRLIYKVAITVVDAAGKELIAPSEILLNRDFSYSDAEILAKEAEEATLIRGMEQEALRQVLRRLSYIKR